MKRTGSDSDSAYWIGAGAFMAASFALTSLWLGFLIVRDLFSFIGWHFCILILAGFMWVLFRLSIVLYPVFAALNRGLGLAGVVLSMVCFCAGVATAMLSSGF